MQTKYSGHSSIEFLCALLDFDPLPNYCSTILAQTDWIQKVARTLTPSKRPVHHVGLSTLWFCLSDILIAHHNRLSAKKIRKIQNLESSRQFNKIASELAKILNPPNQLKVFDRNRLTLQPKGPASKSGGASKRQQSLSAQTKKGESWLKSTIDKLLTPKKGTRYDHALLLKAIVQLHVQTKPFLAEVASQSGPRAKESRKKKGGSVEPLSAEKFQVILGEEVETLKKFDKDLLNILAREEQISEAFVDFLILALRLARPKLFWKGLKAQAKPLSEEVLSVSGRVFKLLSVWGLGRDSASETKLPEWTTRLAESPVHLLLRQERHAQHLKSRDAQISALKKENKGKTTAAKKLREERDKLKGLNSLLKEQVAASEDSAQLFVELEQARKQAESLRQQLSQVRRANAGLEERIEEMRKENSAMREKLQEPGEGGRGADLEDENRRLREKVGEMQSKTREMQMQNQRLDKEQRFNMKELVQLRKEVLEMEQDKEDSILNQDAEEAFHNIWESEDGRNSARLTHRKRHFVIRRLGSGRRRGRRGGRGPGQDARSRRSARNRGGRGRNSIGRVGRERRARAQVSVDVHDGREEECGRLQEVDDGARRRGRGQGASTGAAVEERRQEALGVRRGGPEYQEYIRE